MRHLFLAAFLIIAATASAQEKLGSADMKELRKRITGNFDNQEQVSADPSYAPIILNAREISLKGKKSDGYWIYVEQDMSPYGSRAYHQRIYNIYKHQEGVAAKTYELKNPDAFVGAWRNTDMFRKISVDSLIEGCILYFSKDNAGNYLANTLNRDCLNTVNGAAYATTELIVTPNMIINWDRGWDNSGRQVWGAEKGGYRFRKFTRPSY